MRPAAHIGFALFVLTWVAPSGIVAQPEDAQPRPKVEITADGTELFRALLDLRGITPVKRKDVQNLFRYDDVIVIVLGSNISGTPHDHARRAITTGGAALIATDDNLVLSWPGLGQTSIINAKIECDDVSQILAVSDPDRPGAPPTPLRNCPFVVPVTTADMQEAPDPEFAPIGRVFQGLVRIATNSPGYITLERPVGAFRYPLARFPRETFVVNPQTNKLIPFPRRPYFAVGGDGVVDDTYRFLAVADHSVFINQMLLEPGTDNLELAYRTIDYLQGDGQRKRCLFVENGRMVEEFDGLRKSFANQSGMPLPNLSGIQDKLTDLGNAIVDDVQSRDVPNTILMRTLGLTRVMWAVLALGAIYGTIYLLRRWAAVRKPTDHPPPPTIAGVATGPPGVFERRQKELIRRDNVYEPIRDLVRGFFVSLGVHGDQGPRHPQLRIADTVRKSDSLRKAIRDFWKIAYGPPQEISVARWRELEPYFLRLRDAHAVGKWKFILPGTPSVTPG